MNRIELHVYLYFNDVLKAINHFIEVGINIINLRKIRRYLDIPPSDRSKINFIWRNLEVLEESEIIQLHVKTKTTKWYNLPKEKIQMCYNEKGDLDFITVSTFSREKREKIYLENAKHIT